MTLGDIGVPVRPDPTGDPGLVQLLTPEGERVHHPDYPLEISAEEVQDLYRDLVLVRRIDVEATALQRQGELGIWASLLGQEAAQVGSGRALRPGDMAFPSYREHGVAWCRGVDPLQLLGLYRGTDLGGWDPKEKNFNIYSIVIGSQTLHATGYAMGMQRDGGEDAVIAYFGDGASSQGDVNDVLACLAVTRAALDAARTGQGPTLVEAYTYRMGAHTTSDDPTRYRLASELEMWRLRDPIERVKAYLSRSGQADAAFFEAIEREADELAGQVRQGCIDLVDPEPLSLFDEVYVETTPHLQRQRDDFASYLDSFEEAKH